MKHRAIKTHPYKSLNKTILKTEFANFINLTDFDCFSYNCLSSKFYIRSMNVTDLL